MSWSIISRFLINFAILVLRECRASFFFYYVSFRIKGFLLLVSKKTLDAQVLLYIIYDILYIAFANVMIGSSMSRHCRALQARRQAHTPENTALHNQILNFLTGRPRALQVNTTTSSTLTQHQRPSGSSSNTIIRFADDTTAPSHLSVTTIVPQLWVVVMSFPAVNAFEAGRTSQHG